MKDFQIINSYKRLHLKTGIYRVDKIEKVKLGKRSCCLMFCYECAYYLEIVYSDRHTDILDYPLWCLAAKDQSLIAQAIGRWSQDQNEKNNPPPAY